MLKFIIAVIFTIVIVQITENANWYLGGFIFYTILFPEENHSV